jgi:cell wall-associated NlpC family hydrolase
MDCSGFVWWTMKKNEGGYNAAQYHPDYPGWSLPQRTSSTMAQSTTSKISFGSLHTGDLMFFAGNGGSTYTDVDHVGVYAGNGWMIHSSSGNDGVALSLVTSGWYRDHYVYGRRIIPAGGLLASWAGPATSPYGGDGPRKGSGEDPH